MARSNNHSNNHSNSSSRPRTNSNSSSNSNHSNHSNHPKNTPSSSPPTSPATAPTSTPPQTTPQNKSSFLGDVASTASGIFLGNAVFHTIFGNKSNQPAQPVQPIQNNICQQKFDEYLKCLEINKEQNSFPDNSVCFDKLKLFEECAKSQKNVVQ